MKRTTAPNLQGHEDDGAGVPGKRPLEGSRLGTKGRKKDDGVRVTTLRDACWAMGLPLSRVPPGPLVRVRTWIVATRVGKADSLSRPARGTNGAPIHLRELLRTSSDDNSGEVWTRFVDRHSKLLLHVAHSTTDSYDGAMDRYAFLLQELRSQDYRRLRRYDPEGRGTFTTWLVVVARRLCADYHRSRYGRPRPGNSGEIETSRAEVRNGVRSRLASFIVEELDPSLYGDPKALGPELKLRQQELDAALDEALGQMGAEDRLLFKLRFQDDLPAREIAELMDFPTLFHVYRRVNAGLKSLRASLEQRGITDPRP